MWGQGRGEGGNCPLALGWCGALAGGGGFAQLFPCPGVQPPLPRAPFGQWGVLLG